MKTKAIVAVLLVVLILVACTPTVTVNSRASNFAFVFQYTAGCATTPMYVLDTASGTLVYTPIGDTTSTTISLHLTTDELESIYQKTISIGFFDYPSKFVVPFWQVRGYLESGASYELSMTNSTTTNSVAWRDDAVTKSSYTRANQLRELMKLIYEIIHSHPEVQQLPEGVFCL
jgi:hypothetical protein